ncbi:MAG: hypothetical protein AB7F32_04095, partial [Victivallaceae bacterium]
DALPICEDGDRALPVVDPSVTYQSTLLRVSFGKTRPFPRFNAKKQVLKTERTQKISIPLSAM